MDYFSLVTSGPFDTRTYSTIYRTLPLRKTILALLLFVVIQFTLVVIPQIIFVPRNTIQTWNSLKKSLVPILEQEPFTMVTISNGILSTDLQKRPYAISREDGNFKSFLVVDATDNTTIASINKLPKTTSGIFFTKEHIILRANADAPTILSYAQLMGKTASLSLSKTEILSFLQGGETFSHAVAFIKKPSTVASLTLYGFYIAATYIAKQWLNIGLITAILCILTIALMKKGPLKKLRVVIPLALFASMGYWYVTTIAGAIASYHQTLETFLLPIAIILSPFYFLWLMLVALTTIGKNEEEKVLLKTQSPEQPRIETSQPKKTLTINKNAPSHIGRHFKTKKIQYRRGNIRKTT